MSTLYLLTYDVSVTDGEGDRRLRRVAKACESMGHRVQQSVFECRLTEAQKESLIHRIRGIMKPELDSLRVYQIREPLDDHLEVHGLDHAVDFTDPLIF